MVLESEARGEQPYSHGPPRLTLEHLALDLPTIDDIADLVFLANNRRISEMLARMPYPYTPDDARRWVLAAQRPSAGAATFAVRLRATGRFIGAAGYTPMPESGAVHLGYWIGQPFWDQGYATEAAHAVVDHAFAETPVDELVASVRPTNPASRRVLEKCGFQYRDSGMMRSLVHNGAVAVENYRIDRKTWRALKDWRNAG